MLFKLDLLSQGGSALGTLNVAANDGTKANGFGWDLFGLGTNTGGTWDWGFNAKDGFSILLWESFPDVPVVFGRIEAAWSPLGNPNGYPPEPWFSRKSINSGTLDAFFYNGEVKWRLR